MWGGPLRLRLVGEADEDSMMFFGNEVLSLLESYSVLAKSSACCGVGLYLDCVCLNKANDSMHDYNIAPGEEE